MKPKRKYLYLFVAVFCSAGLVLSGCSGGDDTSSTPPPLPGAEGGIKIGSELIKGLLGGVGGTVDSDLIGWGLGALGIGGNNNDQQQIDEIQNQIKAIQGELTDIQSSVVQLSKDLEDLGCSSALEIAETFKTAIETDIESYNVYLNADTLKDIDMAGMVSWAEAILQNGTSLGILNDLNNLAQALVGSEGQGTGAIPECASSYLTQWQDTALGEQAYYNALHRMAFYNMALQVQGTHIAVEAAHLLAVNKFLGGTRSMDAKEAQQVCIDDPGDANCALAKLAVQNLMINLTEQMETAGAGYSDGTGGTIPFDPKKEKATLGKIVQVGSTDGTTFQTPTDGGAAFVVDINDYDAGECSKPLSSATEVCGGTVGTDDPLPTTSYAGYSGLVPATYQYWNFVLNNTSETGQQTLSAVFKSLGFGPSEKMIILTGEVTGTQFHSDNCTIEYNAVCLMDTNWTWKPGVNWPLCDAAGGGPVGSTLLPTRADWDSASFCHAVSFGHSSAGSRWQLGPDSPNPSNADYYNGSLHCCSDFAEFTGTDTSPGWEDNAGVDPTPQFRWPMLKLDDQTCVNNLNSKNPAGVYTLCGPESYTWMNSYLPLMFFEPETLPQENTATATISAGVFEAGQNIEVKLIDPLGNETVLWTGKTDSKGGASFDFTVPGPFGTGSLDGVVTVETSKELVLKMNVKFDRVPI